MTFVLEQFSLCFNPFFQDPSKFVGPIHYVDVTDIPRSSKFWGIAQTVTYSSSTPIIDLPNTAGIVDTGSTFLQLFRDAFQRYETATGGKIDEEAELLRISTTQFANLQSLFFHIGGRTLEFTPMYRFSLVN